MKAIISTIFTLLLAPAIICGQDFNNFNKPVNEQVVKQSEIDETLDIAPFIGDSLKNLDKKILYIMDKTYEQYSTSLDGITCGRFNAKLGEIQYKILYDWHWLEEVYEIQTFDKNFQVRGLRKGDIVDISRYEKIDCWTEGLSYKIPGTEWRFCVWEETQISYFWRDCRNSNLFIDEVMLENM